MKNNRNMYLLVKRLIYRLSIIGFTLFHSILLIIFGNFYKSLFENVLKFYDYITKVYIIRNIILFQPKANIFCYF